jgi:hypothetical protein
MISRRRFLSGLALGVGYLGLPEAARAGLFRRRCPGPSDCCCWPPCYSQEASCCTGDYGAAPPATGAPPLADGAGAGPAATTADLFAPPAAPYLRLWRAGLKDGPAIPEWTDVRLDNNLVRTRYGYVSGSRMPPWTFEFSSDLYLRGPADRGITYVVTHDSVVPAGSRTFSWRLDGRVAAAAEKMRPALRLRMAAGVVGGERPRVLFDETDNWVGGKNRVKEAWRQGKEYPVSPGEVVRLAWVVSVDRTDAGQEEIGTAWVACRPGLSP